MRLISVALRVPVLKPGTGACTCSIGSPNFSGSDQADGKVTEEQEGVSLDLSHTDQGYFMVAYQGSADKLMVQVEGSDNIPY